MAAPHSIFPDRATSRFSPPHSRRAIIVSVLVLLLEAACTPIELPPPVEEGPAPPYSSGEGEHPDALLLPGLSPILDVGEEMPDLDLTTQLGQPLELTDLAGTVVVLGFFSCQQPRSSPGTAAALRLIELQDTLRADLWDRVRIVTISTEPLIDTPDVLLRCGSDLGTNPDRWTLTTMMSADFTAIAARLGVLIWDEEGDETAHTLSTLVIDQQGILADRFRGLTQWTVGDLIASVVQVAER
jgi:cytochrome oxidase Cu insertion factor (SCO1/SenC/PrrC family)